MKALIEVIFNNFNIRIDSIELVLRGSVDYSLNIHRKVYFLKDSNNIKYICKVFEDPLEDSIYKETLYKTLQYSPHAIPPIQWKNGNYLQSVDNSSYILFPYHKLDPLVMTNVSLLKKTISSYDLFITAINDISISETHESYRKNLLKILIYLSCVSTEFTDIISVFFEPVSLQKQLMVYYKNYINSIHPTLIHWSLWIENIYTISDIIYIIDLDNVTIGDPYYDIACLGLMFFNMWYTVSDIIDTFTKNYKDFNQWRFHQVTLFVILSTIRNLHPSDKKQTIKDLKTWITYYHNLWKYISWHIMI